MIQTSRCRPRWGLRNLQDMRRLPTSLWRFGVVGLLATALHIALVSLLVETRVCEAVAANGLAFIGANLSGYVANTRWSFAQRLSFASWQRYLLVSLAGWLLSMLIAALVQRAGGHYLLGVALVVSVVPVANFLGHRLYTYRLREPHCTNPQSHRGSLR